MDETSQRVANTMSDIIATYDGVEYVNMIREPILAYNTDINIDGGHVNYSGACKTCSWLGSYIRNHYVLDDYSNDSYWSSAYEDYLQYRIAKMQEQDSLCLYLMLLKNPGINVNIEFYDESLWYNELIASELYFGNLSPNVADNGPEGAIAHITVFNPDGSIADDAYFAYNEDWSDALRMN